VKKRENEKREKKELISRLTSHFQDSSSKGT
jgi:hypothetical protein